MNHFDACCSLHVFGRKRVKLVSYVRLVSYVCTVIRVGRRMKCMSVRKLVNCYDMIINISLKIKRTSIGP